MVTLVIAEKPSVARDLAKVLGAKARRDGYLEGAGYRVSWCRGHLLELCEPKDYDPAWKRWDARALPMIPGAFKTRPRRGASAQLAVLRKLARARDVDTVINACDAGREGELIFRYTWDAIAPRRGHQPTLKRLWISSLTEGAIRAGLGALRDAGEFDRLGAAARCRSEADWLVGMNATRALTLHARRGGAGKLLLSVGRVQTPTLAMICRREDEIEAFTPEPFWQVKVRVDLRAPERHLEATYIHQGRDRLDKPEDAVGIVLAVNDKPARIGQVERKEVRERPPALYDLTALQKTANRRYGLSAQRTLTAAQALYERHKALTYPRTDSRFVTADVAQRLPTVLRKLQGTPWGAIADEALRGGPKPTRRIVNAAEVGDHHALLPTGKVPPPGRLSGDEQKVYDLVVRRTLAVFLPAAVFAKTTIEALAAVDPQTTHRFVAKGTTRLVEGWQLAEPPSRRRASETAASQALPIVQPGEAAHIGAARVHEGVTTPPSPYTEATLLAGMERAGKELEEEELRRAMRASGLGTPATRAAIIETLLTRTYIERQGRSLRATAQGRALVKALPVAALRSPELTGRWEAALSELAEGRGDRLAFMSEITTFTTEVVRALREAAPPTKLAEAIREAGGARGDEVLGACPLCGEPVREGFKAYTCATGRGCEFVIFKSIAKRKISPALVRVLLSRRRSQVLKGFRSKAGKRFSAALVLGEDGKARFDFGRGEEGRGGRDRGRRGAPSSPEAPRARRPSQDPRAPREPRPRAPADPRPRCPKCRQGRIIEGRRGWGCSRYREGCDFVVWFEQGPRRFRVPADEAERLFRRRQTRLMVGLVDDAKARLVLDLSVEGNVRVELGKRR